MEWGISCRKTRTAACTGSPARTARSRPHGDDRPLPADGPLHLHHQRVAVGDVGDVGEGDVGRDLLFERQARLRVVFHAGQARVDLQRVTPKKRCRRPATGLAIAWPSSADAPICCHDCGARRLPGHQLGVRGGGAPGGQQRDDLVELQRRVRTRRQIQLLDRSGDRQGHVDAARLGFQVHVQDRLDPRRVEERNRPLVDVCTASRRRPAGPA